MSSHPSGPAGKPVPTALCLFALAFAVAILCAATAQAADYKMCQRPSRIPQRRPSNLPADGHVYSPPVAIGSPRLSPSLAAA